MGIEPTREARLGLETKQFGAMADPKWDGRVNFRGMWGHVRLRRDTRRAKSRARGYQPYVSDQPTVASGGAEIVTCYRTFADSGALIIWRFPQGGEFYVR